MAASFPCLRYIGGQDKAFQTGVVGTSLWRCDAILQLPLISRCPSGARAVPAGRLFLTIYSPQAHLLLPAAAWFYRIRLRVVCKTISALEYALRWRRCGGARRLLCSKTIYWTAA